MEYQEGKLRVGFIGLGGRGQGILDLILDMDDIEVSAVCDCYEDRAQKGVEIVQKKRSYAPVPYTNYKELLKRDDIDVVLSPSSWTSHADVAIASMKAGIPVGFEVGGATSIQQCWDLVHTAEETGVSCSMLENCCYGREELLVLNMVKKGLFGEIIHCQGGYQHDLREEIDCGVENRHYRIDNYSHRNGELYPTHELGPVSKVLNINRGNRFLTLTSMSTKARGLNQWALDHKGPDDKWATYPFPQGDVVTTMIKCANGESIVLVHDTSLPRPYSRNGRVQGTKAIWSEDKNGIYIDGRSPQETWQHEWEPISNFYDEYDHPLWKEFVVDGVKGGHGGMDWLVLRGFLESVKNKVAPPIDVYDSVAWMSITCLSEDSIAMGSQPVPVPDFTNGKWIKREPIVRGKYCLDDICEECFRKYE